MAELVEPLDLALRNTRVLVRRVAVAAYRRDALPQAYARLCRDLADAVDDVAAELRADRLPDRGAAGAGAARGGHLATSSATDDLSGEVVLAQLRSIIADLLRITGMGIAGGDRRDPSTRPAVSGARGRLGHNRCVSDDPGSCPSPTSRPPAGAGRGYVADDVDEFVEELRRSLRHDPPGMAPYEVTDQRFPVRRRGRGYALRPVDDYLDHARAVLRERHGGDALASLEGHSTPPEHFPTWWIYLLALVLVAAVVVFTVAQL